MLERKIAAKLVEWQKRKKRKCLILQGARQVGKTYSIRLFGTDRYKEMLEINFKENPSAAEIFSGDLTVDTIITSMRFRFPDKKILPGKTLIFLDEIQECEEAVTALKFFSQDGRFDVIASGSMLGIDYKRASSYPVGYVEHEKMRGLDFEEYLWSRGIRQDLIQSVKECYDRMATVPEAIHTQMMGYLREYIALGGMPEVVQSFADTGDYRVADRTQRDILTGYQYDIAHYATAEEKVKAEKCFLSLGRQLLGKENRKFQYKEVEHGGRAQKYYSSIEWLLRADLIQLCRLTTDVRYDLEDYARNDFFRAYTTDLSLLVAMRDFSLKQQIIENTISGTTKGGIYECVVADIFLKKEKEMFFYKNDSAQKEIDFLIQTDGMVVPVEVKSGNTRATSLKWLKKRCPDISRMIKLADGNTGKSEEGIVTLPLYMAMFL